MIKGRVRVRLGRYRSGLAIRINGSNKPSQSSHWQDPHQRPVGVCDGEEQALLVPYSVCYVEGNEKFTVPGT